MRNRALPLSRNELEAIVHRYAENSANVDFTDHCLQRLVEREVTMIEALRCLRRGTIIERSLEYDSRHDTWKFRIQELPPRDIVCLVAAVSLDPTNRTVIAITVWEI
jgi:hypothetical protein